MSIRSQRISTIASRLGSGLWPRWLVWLHSVYVATTASVISGNASFRRMSVAITRSLPQGTVGRPSLKEEHLFSIVGVSRGGVKLPSLSIGRVVRQMQENQAIHMITTVGFCPNSLSCCSMSRAVIPVPLNPDPKKKSPPRVVLAAGPVTLWVMTLTLHVPGER